MMYYTRMVGGAFFEKVLFDTFFSFSHIFPFFPPGEMGTVAGWGRLSEGGQLPNILQYVSIPSAFFSFKFET